VLHRLQQVFHLVARHGEVVRVAVEVVVGGPTMDESSCGMTNTSRPSTALQMIP